MRKPILINIVIIAINGKYTGSIILAISANNNLEGIHKNKKYNIILSIL